MNGRVHRLLIFCTLVLISLLSVGRTKYFKAVPVYTPKPSASFSIEWWYDSEIHTLFGTSSYIDLKKEDFNRLCLLLQQWMNYGEYMRAQYETVLEERATLKKQLENTMEKLRDTEKKLKDATETIYELTIELAKATETIQSLETELAKASETIQKKEENLKDTIEKLMKTETVLKDTRDKLVEYQEKANKYGKELNKAKTQLETLNNQLSKANTIKMVLSISVIGTSLGWILTLIAYTRSRRKEESEKLKSEEELPAFIKEKLSMLDDLKSRHLSDKLKAIIEELLDIAKQMEKFEKE